jgi:hypothetical protein
MSEAQCQYWINTYGLTHPVLADPNRVVWNLFTMGYVPHNAIVDGDMILRYTDYGFDEPLVVATIEFLLFSMDHVALGDFEDQLNPYPMECSVRSVYDLMPDEPLLHWNLDGGSSFTDVIMTTVPADDYTDTYTAEIPAQPYGTTVYYYLSAANTIGETVTHPTGAPTELHSFFVGVDTTPPVIEHATLRDQLLARWPATVSATVTDNLDLPIDSVTLEFTINGGPVQSVPMLPTRDGLYSADFVGSVSLGDTVEYRIVAVDSALTPNTATDPETGYHPFTIVDQLPVLIFEPDDATPWSGVAITQTLDTLGLSYEVVAELPADRSPYRTIFVLLGVYPNNHELTPDEGQALAEYLDGGGQLYMEGGDTWFWDPATAVHSYFHINGLSDGSGDAGPIEGASGTFTEGMYFTYSGENSYIDHLAPIDSALPIFLNVSPAYINGIAYDGNTYRTIGTSFEFGSLVDGASPSTKEELLLEFMNFFNLVFVDGFESGDTAMWSSTVP